MIEVAIPVILSLLLGPGVGQLYNREYKKGTYLIVLSLVVLLAAVAWFRAASMPYLPTDVTSLDKEALQAMVENAVTKVLQSHPRTVYTYEFLLVGIWIYSVVDAYRGALRRRQAQNP